MWLNVGCGEHNAAAPWWNIDVVEKDAVPEYGAIRPDQIVPRGYPLPFEAGSCDRIMLSHVLEHTVWGKPIVDLMAEMRRLLSDDGRVCIVGPDTKRTLALWHQGQLSTEMMEGIIEDARADSDLIGDWPEARHHWNCYEDRVLRLLRLTGFPNHRAVAIPGPELDGWPVVGPATWQFAVLVDA